MGTGWHAAVAAGVREGDTVVVVGDGAVGLSGVLAAARMGAERIIAMSRHESRQRIAREFGATDIVEARGDEGVAAVMELTDGVGADAVLECVGTNESMTTAIAAARPGATVGYVGVPHGIEYPVRRHVRPQRRHRRRHRPRPPVPPAAARRRARRGDQPGRRSSTSRSRSPTSPRPTPPWTSAAPSSP